MSKRERIEGLINSAIVMYRSAEEERQGGFKVLASNTDEAADFLMEESIREEMAAEGIL